MTIEYRNPHWNNPNRDFVYLSYHDDISERNVGGVRDDGVSSSERMTDFTCYFKTLNHRQKRRCGVEKLFIGGVYRDDLYRIHEALSIEMVDDETKEKAQYG